MLSSKTYYELLTSTCIIFSINQKMLGNDDDDARRQDEDIIKLMICFDQQIDVIKTTSNQWSHTVLYIQSNNAQFSIKKRMPARCGDTRKYLNSWIMVDVVRCVVSDVIQFFTSHHHHNHCEFGWHPNSFNRRTVHARLIGCMDLFNKEDGIYRQCEATSSRCCCAVVTSYY